MNQQQTSHGEPDNGGSYRTVTIRAMAWQLYCAESSDSTCRSDEQLADHMASCLTRAREMYDMVEESL